MQATFRTHAVPVVTETTVVLRNIELGEWARQAPLLPRDTSVSLVLVPATDGGPPFVLMDEITAGAVPRDAASTMAAGGELVSERSWAHPYRELSDFAAPRGPGYEPPSIEDERWQTIAVLVSVAGTVRVIDEVVAAVADAPTPWCRVDFQHVGGALADVSDVDTAFWGRRAEHSVVVTAVWPAGAGDAVRERCRRWLTHLRDVLAAASVGVYASDIRHDENQALHDVTDVFGGNLERVRTIASIADPHGRFRFAPPFT